MWESTFFVDFQGLWEERETALYFPLFPSGRHFHRWGVIGFWDVIRPIDSTRVFLVTPLSLLVWIFVSCFRSCCAFTVASAWLRRLFSTIAVWLTRWSLLKTR
jgi:hypothetical protein